MSKAKAQETPEQERVCKLFWEMADHYKFLLKIVTYSEISSAVVAAGFALYIVVGLTKAAKPEQANLWLSVVASVCSGAALGTLVKKRDSYKVSLDEATKNILKHCKPDRSPSVEINR
jgi:hypothetical protein